MTQEHVGQIRACYPKGMRVELVSLEYPYSQLQPGDQGVVDHVDDTGTILVHWDCGSFLGIISGVDQIKSLEAKSTEKIAIHKCQNCGSIAENIIFTDDGEPYIVCNWCGAEIDIPFGQVDEA